MRHTQSGNAFIYVLVAIALFAALAYTFTRSAQQGGSGNISKQEAAIAASEILSYARTIESAVNRVRVKNRCSENEISFEYDGYYINPSAPGTKKCHIFEPEGGNIEYLTMNPNTFSNGLQYFGFNAGFQFTKVGSDLNDLALQLNYLKKDVCLSINDKLGIPNNAGEPPEENNDPAGTEGTFKGTFGTNKADTVGDDGTGLSGKMAFCRLQSSVPHYQFIYVLLAR